MIEREFNRTRYFAKLMLFGEYSIINNSKALTVPFKHHSGELSFIPDNKYTNLDYAKQSNKQLRAYASFVGKQLIDGIINFSIDSKKLIKDIDEGLYFDSSIPQGYGAGSSGALIAAIYDKYVTVPATSEVVLRSQLATLEHFFHGKSSGIDPLVAFFEKTLLIDGQGFKAVEKPNFSPTGKEAFFLFDTNQTSKTEPLVKSFLSDCENGVIDADFLTELNNAIIDKALSTNYDEFMTLLTQLSEWQLKHMHKMIPKNMETPWKKGLDKQLWVSKLCGSGGGGYILGFTTNYDKALEELHKTKLKIIPVQTPEY